MAEYDGSIRIDTGIDTKGVKKGVQEILKDLERLKAIQKEFLDIGGDKGSSIYKEREKDIQKLEEALKSAQQEAQKEIEIPDTNLNQLKTDVEEYAKSLKELQEQGKFFGDEDYDRVYIAWKNAADAVKAYQAELNKQTESGQAKLAEQEAKAAERKEAAQRKAEEQAERALQKENARIQKEIDNQAKLEAREMERQAKEEARINALQAKEEAKRAKEIAAIQAEEQEEQRLDQIRVNATTSNQQIIDLTERRKQLIAEISDMERAGVGLGYTRYESANKELEEINAKIKEYKRNLSSVSERFNNMQNSAKKAFDAITTGTKQSNVSLSGGFKTILKYGFGIRSLYMLFNKIRNGIKEGFTNLMGYSDSFANSIQSVKNSMKTLGNQIAGAFRPIVEMVIPWINSLINALTAAMAKLAQFIAVLGGKSTFTRAKQIQDAYNKSLGGTAKAADKARGALAKFDDLDVLEKKSESGDGAGSTVGDMFEEVPIDNAKIISGLLDKLASLLKKIKESAKGALTALSKLWNEGLSLLANFAWDTLRDFYNQFLVPVGKWVLGEGLPRFFEITNNLLKSISWGSLLKSLRGFYDVLAKMAKFTFKALLDLYEHFLAPVATWTMNKALPTLLKTLTDLGNKIKWDVLNSALQSMFKTLSKFAVGIGNGLILFWQGIEPIMTTALAGTINVIAEALRFLSDILGMIPEDVLAVLGGALAGFLSVFITYQTVTGIMGAITGAWTHLWQSLQAGISVLAANPYLAVAAGIGAMVGALIALDEKAAERSQIEQYGQTIDALCTSINNRSEAIKNQSNAVKSYVDDAGLAELMLAEDLAGKYYDLAQQENLTNAQKEEMKALSERLVELVPELSKSLNEETGMISAQKDEVYDLIEAKREQYRLEAAKESIVDAYRNQLEAEKNLKEATDLTKQAQEAYNEEVRKYNAAMEDYNKHAYDFAEAPTFQYVVEAKDNWKDLAAELETASEAFDSTQESIKFLESVMESGGKDCTDGFVKGYDSDQMVQTVRDSAQSCIDAFKAANDSHSPSKVYEGLAKDTIDGYVVGIEKNKASAISVIQQWCMELKDAFVSALSDADLFSGMFAGINEQIAIFRESWRETFTLWQEENTELFFGYDIWYEQWKNMLTAYNDVNSEFMSEWQSNMKNWWDTMVMPYFSLEQWKTFGENMKNGIMLGFKAIVNNIASILNQLLQLFNAGYKQLQDSMNSLIDDYNTKASIMGTGALSHVNYRQMQSIKVPALASGAVIRGGNPFMAILGDQPHGQVNVETPAKLIKDMVAQGIAEAGIGSRENVPVNINIIYDGETTARVMIPDILSELSRQGYNVDLLGYT